MSVVRLLAALAVSLVAGAAVPAGAATGGPDGFGYSWADSAEFNVTAVAPGFTPTDLRSLGFTGDESLIRLDLRGVFPAGFPFYGTGRGDLWLSSNGWISFVDPGMDARPVPAGIPAAFPPNTLLAWLWDDWTLDHVASLATAGPNDAGDGYTITVRIARPDLTTRYTQVWITLFADGSIKLVYRRDTADLIGPATVIGIEDDGGLDGLPIMDQGELLNGAVLWDPYALQIFPGGRLDCAGATLIPCPLAPTTYDTTTGVNLATGYNCAVGGWDASELVFELTLAEYSDVTASVSGTAGRYLVPFLLRAGCNESTSCLVGGAPTVTSRLLSPGTYHVVVDGSGSGDDGPFTLAVDCVEAVTRVACGEVMTGHGTSGVGVLSSWRCRDGLTGPERVYSVDVPVPSTVRATLSAESDPGLHVLISDEAGLDVRAPDCLAEDTTSASHVAAVAGRYLVTVDGLAGVSGTYDLAIDCGRALACPGPIPIDPRDPTPIVGDTSGGSDDVQAYHCLGSGWGPPGVLTGYSGAEAIYTFTLAATETVAFLFTASDPGLRLLLLNDCFEGSCLMEGACAEALEPGTYYLVVDGLDGAMGSYSITPLLVPAMPSYRPWHECRECDNGCGQDFDAVRRRRWSFDSGNYCGTGCDFSMFAVVDCGTELHLPLFDVETGRLGVYDVLRARDVELTARNDALLPACSYLSTGTTVEWRDEGCSMVPCPDADCGGGEDCRTDNATMDVSFRSSPSACGVYRLDFADWGGFAWDLYANCTGTQLEDFFIYPDLCTALANYAPLPEAGIADVTIDNDECDTSTAMGTVTVVNLGCAPLVGMELVIEQAPPAAPRPESLAVNVAPAGTVTLDWRYVLTALPGALRFRLDPADAIEECSEAPATRVGCGIATVQERERLMDACTCIGDARPPAIGNSLLAVRDGRDVSLRWVPLVAAEISVHRLYRDADPTLPLATRERVRDVAATAASAVDVGVVYAPPTPLANYQVIGVSCGGGLEGPY